MVMVQRQQATSMRRQSSCPGTLGNKPQRGRGSPRHVPPSTAARRTSGGSFVSCAMGDEDNLSVSSHPLSSFGSSLASSSAKNASSILPSTSSGSSRNLYHKHQHVKTPRWVLVLLCFFTALSWIRAVQYRTTSFEVLSAMEAELAGFEFQKKQSTRLLKDAMATRNTFAKQKWKLKKTQRLFQHETRMLEEMTEMEASSASDNVEIPDEALEKFRNRRSGDIAKKWIEHRQEAILHKVYNLQAYVQDQSRKRVIEKYGHGPYHVRFDVKSREGRKPGSFMVRMAPLNTVPHSVEAFLEMVTNKVWDNTIFYSHHSQSHVIAAAPLTYGTFRSKDHELEAMGYTGVGFPEYSKDFPHKRNTVGFMGTGPNFYVNAVSNEDHHGPGGEGHNMRLPGDADPCFGVIINGFDVLRDMQYGRHKGDRPSGWQDYDLTRIITATFVPFL